MSIFWDILYVTYLKSYFFYISFRCILRLLSVQLWSFIIYSFFSGDGNRNYSTSSYRYAYTLAIFLISPFYCSSFPARIYVMSYKILMFLLYFYKISFLIEHTNMSEGSTNCTCVVINNGCSCSAYKPGKFLSFITHFIFVLSPSTIIQFLS